MTTSTTRWAIGLATGATLLGGLVWFGCASRRRRSALGLITPPQRKAAKAYLSETKRALKTLEAKTTTTEASLHELKTLAAKTHKALAAKREAALYESDIWDEPPIYESDDEDAEVIDAHEDAEELFDRLDEVSVPNAEGVDDVLDNFEDFWKSPLKTFRQAIEAAEED